MGRNARDRRPHLPRIERIELNEEHIWPRLIAAGALLVLGAVMLGYAFLQLMSPEVDWMEIQASSSGGTNCGEEFTFLYCPGDTAERRAVTLLYTELCQTAYEQFHERETFEGVNNIYSINHSPNEPLTVDKALYDALEAVVESGSRLLYLGPVYTRYGNLFFCESDEQLVDFDPEISEDVAQEYREAAAFASDPEMIRLELLGEYQVELVVSEEYLAYADWAEIEDFIDFAWMRNAFIADYMAEELIAQGFTKGALSSYDGFVRNLDGSGTSYSLQLYDRQGRTVYPAAVMEYTGPMSVVMLRDYPLSGLDVMHYYELSSGEIRTPYLDPADGRSRNAVHNLVCYAKSKSCGETLLKIAPIYIADALQAEALERLTAEGIQSIRFENGVIRPTEAGAVLSELYDKDGVRYTVAR